MNVKLNHILILSLLLAGMAKVSTPVWAEESSLPAPPPEKSETAPANPTDATTEKPTEIKPPEGTMAPVTLKATLEKSKVLPLTLDQALQLALGQNITIAIQGERYQQRRLEALFRLSELLPDVTPQYSQSRFIGAVQIFGGQTLEIFRTTYQPQLTANYTIYSAGRNIFEIQASRQRQDVQKNLLEDARQDIMTQVALEYYNMQLAYWQRAIAIQAIKEAEYQVSLNKAHYEAGVGVKLDYLQAQSNLANRKRELIQAENTIARSSDRLVQLLNLDFEVDIVPPVLESTITPIFPEETPFTKLVSIAKTNNPRLKALEKLQQASRTDVKVAIADLFPKFDITGYLNGTGPGLSNLGFSRFAGVQVSTNVLENMGFGKPLRIKTTKSLAREAQLNVNQATRLLEESLSNNMVDLKTIEAQITVAKEGLSYAQAAYEQAVGRLREGVGTNVDLEVAQASLTRARSDLATAFLNYNKTQVALLFNLGVTSIDTLTQGYNPHGTSHTAP